MTKDKPLVSKVVLLEKFPGKGGWTYCRLPEIKPNRKNPFGWLRVKGTIDQFELQAYHLMPMGNGELFLPVRAEIRRQIRKKSGDFVNVTLFYDHEPLPVPEDLGNCLKDEPQTAKKFDLLTTTQKDAAIRHINNAKSQNTRESRIAALLNQLSVL